MGWLSQPYKNLREINSLGFSMAQIGAVNAITPIVVVVLAIPAGWLADKFNPVRTFVFVGVLGIMPMLAQSVWAFADFGHLTFGPWTIGPWTLGPWNGNLVYLYFVYLGFIPLSAISGVAQMPFNMRLLPKDRYGQFMSANSMVTGLLGIFGGFVVGKFIASLGVHGQLAVSLLAGMDTRIYVPGGVLPAAAVSRMEGARRRRRVCPTDDLTAVQHSVYVATLATQVLIPPWRSCRIECRAFI